MLLKNDNKKFIKTLADNCLKANRIRNRIALLAIILTAVLFTAITTVFQGAEVSIKEQKLQMSGSRFMTSIKNMSPQKAKELLADDAFTEVGAERVVSFAENQEFNQISAIVSWMDEVYAKGCYSDPEKGHLPQKADEIACSSVVLELLGRPFETGSRFTLKYSVNGQQKEKEMTVCGIWEGRGQEQIVNLLVSQAFLDENIDESMPAEEDGAAGQYVIRGSFHSEKKIDEQLNEVLVRAGFNPRAERGEDGFIIHHVNPVYETKSDMGLSTIAGIGAAVLLVLLAGYLIIYNIFRISVIKDIRLYGQLKTVGTSPKQIQYMVKRQGTRLAYTGIPAGLVLGWLLGNGLLQLVMKTSNYSENIFIWPNLLVWAASAAFTFITVWISCRRPGKIAGRISPVEALRYQEQESGKKARQRGRTSSHRILRMACSNLGRNKGKTVLVVLSMSLSIVLMNSVLNAVGSFDMETYVKRETLADFTVMNNMMEKPSEKDEGKMISQDFAEHMKELPGVKNYGQSYLYERPVTEDDDMIKTPAMIKAVNGTTIPESSADGIVPDRMVTGFDENILERGTLVEGEMDYQKLSTGKYILMVGYLDDYNEYNTNGQEFHAGDTVEIELKGEVMSYEVLAVVGMPFRTLPDYSLGGYEMVGFSENVFLDKFPEVKGPIRCVFDAEQGSFDELNAYLESQCDAQNIRIGTRLSAEQDFESMMVSYSGVGIILSLVLAVIGMLNLINVILTGAIARQAEFATMRSIGMSGRQLRKLFLLEGMFYAGLAGAAGIVFGGILSVTMVKGILDGIWFGKYQFIIWPSIPAALAGVCISAVIAVVIDRMWNKGSIVEKLNRAE